MALLEAGQGGDVNEIPNGYTMLYQAVLDREIVAIAALLRHGADPNLGYIGHECVNTLLLSTFT